MSDQVKPAPQLGTALDTDDLVGMGALENRIGILVDIDQLTARIEIDPIADLAV